jgi:hypothetical protein
MEFDIVSVLFQPLTSILFEVSNNKFEHTLEEKCQFMIITFNYIQIAMNINN